MAEAIWIEGRLNPTRCTCCDERSGTTARPDADGLLFCQRCGGRNARLLSDPYWTPKAPMRPADVDEDRAVLLAESVRMAVLEEHAAWFRTDTPTTPLPVSVEAGEGCLYVHWSQEHGIGPSDWERAVVARMEDIRRRCGADAVTLSERLCCFAARFDDDTPTVPVVLS